MSTDTIRICHTDHEQLRLRLSLTESARTSGPLAELQTELDRAVVMPDGDLPPTVARIGSHVQVKDLESGEVEDYVLSLPEDSQPEQGRLSVLAPLGIAILGYSQGEAVASAAPGGIRRLRLLKVA